MLEDDFGKINGNFITFDDVNIELPENVAETVRESDEDSQIIFSNFVHDLYCFGLTNAEIYVITAGINIYGFYEWIDKMKDKKYFLKDGEMNEDWLELTTEIALETNLIPIDNAVYMMGITLIKTFNETPLKEDRSSIHYDEKERLISFYNGESFKVSLDFASGIEVMDYKKIFPKFLKYLGQKEKTHAEVYVIVDGLSNDENFDMVLIGAEDKSFEEIEEDSLKNTKLKAEGNNVLENGKVLISFKDQSASKIFE